MAHRTQGTQLYVLDETVSPSVVVEIGCPTNLNLGGSTRDQIETTCLNATERTYESGLGTPAQETFDLIFDADDDSHRLLEAMQASGEKAQFYAGLSDGTNPPTVAGGNLVAATGRTGWVWEASVVSFPINLPLNEVVRASTTLQRSGARVRTNKNP